MKSSRWSLALALMVLLSVVLAGCAAGAENKYIEDMNKVQEKAAKNFEKVGSSASDEKEAKALIASFDSLVKDMEAIDPPPKWKKHHQDMIDAMKDSGDALEASMNAKPGDAKALTDALTKITNAQTKYAAAVDAINKDQGK